jgi:hypothetical protein
MASKRALLAVLLVLATVATPLVGAVAAADRTEAAELTVRQESYVGGDVDLQTQNGTPIYSAEGERILIVPQNFAPENVVDFGVDRGTGELAFDQGLGAYTFSSEGEVASFGLYWVVLEETQVAGANATNSTAVDRVRYEATVRITGQADLDHAEAGTVEEMRRDANNWRSFNDTLQDVRESDLLFWALRKEPPDTETLLQGMVNTYVTSRDPFRLLTGGLFAVIITLTFTLGGLLFLAMREGLGAWKSRKLWKRLRTYRSNEPYEGELSERLLEADRAERSQIWSNSDFQDMGWSDHEADAYRELGRTPREAFEQILSIMPPEQIIRERLQAMAQVGYSARVLDRDADDEIADAEVVPIEDVDDDQDDVASLADPSDALVEAVWNDHAMIHFDPTEADIDVSEFEQEPTTVSIDELADELPVQIERFEDEKALAKLVHEHVDTAARSEYCDEQGTPNTSMRALGSFLETSTWVRDTHGFPAAGKLAEMLETAIRKFDPGLEAAEYADDVRSGKDA